MSRLLARIVVLAWLLLAGAVAAPAQEPPQEPDPAEPAPKPRKVVLKAEWDLPPADNVDLHGDPMPAGARARIGSSRLRDENVIAGMIFSPDGKMIASSQGYVNGATLLFDTATGRRVGRLKGVSDGDVWPVAFFDGGKMLATVGDGRVSFWRLSPTIGTPAKGPEADHAVPCGAGRLALMHEGRIVIWDLAAQKVVTRFGEDCVQVLATADGRRVATVQRVDKEMVLGLWDAETGKLVKEALRQGPVLGAVDIRLEFSPDDRRLSAGMPDDRGWLRFWSAATGEAVASQPWKYRFARFSPDGKSRLEVGIGTVKLFDAATDELLWQRATTAAQIAPVQFSPDGTRLAIAEVSRIRLFETRSGREFMPAGDNQSVELVRLSADGKTVLTHPLHWRLVRAGLPDETMPRLWSTARGAPLDPPATWKLPHPLQLSKDLESMACVRGQKTLETWNLTNGQKRSEIALAPKTTVLEVSRDLALFVRVQLSGGSSEPMVGDLCDVRTGKPLARLFEFEQVSWPVLAFSPLSRYVAVESHPGPDSEVRIWDIAAGRWAHTFSKSTHVFFSMDDRVVAVFQGADADASDRSPLRFYDLATGKRLPVPADSALARSDLAWFHSPRFLPDGRRFLTCHYDSVTLWDRVDGRRVKTWPIEAHSIQISDDGRTLLTRRQGEVLIWDLAEMMKGL